MIASAVLAIEVLGSLAVMFYVIQAWGLLLVSPSANRAAARVRIAEGAINGLSFKLAATLLKAIHLHDWQHIGMLAVMILLRTLLKKLFAWERLHLLRQSPEIQRCGI